MDGIGKKTILMNNINLVTGGAGFIGSHLIDRLLSMEEKVICLDDLSSGSFENLKNSFNNKNFQFHKYDITKPFDFKVNRIWHLASLASPKAYIKSSIKTINTCYLGSLNALDLARKCDASILLASSSEVYGNPMVHPQTEDYFGNVNNFGERACYAEGKRISETLFYEYRKKYNINIKISRIFNTYGPRLNLYDGRVIPRFIRKIYNNKPVTIYGSGNQTRSFCYVHELIDALLLQMKINFQDPINLGNPQEISIKDLAQDISMLMEKDISFKFLKEKGDDPLVRKPSIELAKKVLNWQPVVNLKEGLSETIDFFSKKGFK